MMQLFVPPLPRPSPLPRTISDYPITTLRDGRTQGPRPWDWGSRHSCRTVLASYCTSLIRTACTAFDAPQLHGTQRRVRSRAWTGTRSNSPTSAFSAPPPRRTAVVLAFGLNTSGAKEMWYSGRVSGAFAGGRSNIAPNACGENVYVSGCVGARTCA
jgi:hypothetical protein